MLNLVVNGKYVYYAVYFENDYDDETIKNIYKNKVYFNQNDATLITDIQMRTNVSRSKKTKIIDLNFDYIYSFNDSSEELKEIQKQQLIDIFTNMRFVKIFEESLPEIESLQVNTILNIFPYITREEVGLHARRNTDKYFKILEVLKNEGIIENKPSGELTEENIKLGNFEDFYAFVAENATKGKVKRGLNKLLIKR